MIIRSAGRRGRERVGKTRGEKPGMREGMVIVSGKVVMERMGYYTIVPMYRHCRYFVWYSVEVIE